MAPRFNFYDYETDSGSYECDGCGEWIERNTLHMVDGLELCDACAETHLRQMCDDCLSELRREGVLDQFPARTDLVNNRLFSD